MLLLSAKRWWTRQLYCCDGLVRKVLLVGYGDAVVGNEVEAMDVGGHLFRGGENLSGFLDLYAETMMMEVTLEPIITMIAVSQETKVAYFHDLIS